MSTDETTQTNSTPEVIAQVKNNMRDEIMAMPTTELVDRDTWTQMMTISKVFFQSKAIPPCWENHAQVFVGLQAGKEMGMQPIEAMNSLYPVNGTINIWGKAVVKRFKIHGWDIAYDETPETCTATVTKGDIKYVETYRFEDAKKSGHTNTRSGELKIGWREGANRIRKLRYGALAMILHNYLPELLGPVNDIQEVAADYIDEVQAEKTNKIKTLSNDDLQAIRDRVKSSINLHRKETEEVKQ